MKLPYARNVLVAEGARQTMPNLPGKEYSPTTRNDVLLENQEEVVDRRNTVMRNILAVYDCAASRHRLIEQSKHLRVGLEVDLLPDRMSIGKSRTAQQYTGREEAPAAATMIRRALIAVIWSRCD